MSRLWVILVRVLLSMSVLTAGVISVGHVLPGDEIAFTMAERMYVVDVGSGILHALAPRDVARTLGWSPDGGALLFFAEGQRGGRRVYAMDARAAHTRPVLESPRTIPDGVWSPDGEQIAFSDGVTLYLAPIADTQSARALRTFDSLLIRVLAWSPDGAQLAVFGSSGLGSYRIYLVDAQSGAFRAHVRGEGYAWSPDGAQVVFDNASQISLLNQVTERGQVIADGYSPSWSPDGEWIALARLADAHYLIVRHIASGHERALVRSDALIGAVDWRP